MGVPGGVECEFADELAGVGVVKSLTETWLPGVVANTDRKRQLQVNTRLRHFEMIKERRSGLAGSRDAYRQWAAGARNTDAPNIVGDEWFEALRPYLPTSGEAAQFRTAHEIQCDNPTVILLSSEISRVERMWNSEASQ